MVEASNLPCYSLYTHNQRQQDVTRKEKRELLRYGTLFSLLFLNTWLNVFQESPKHFFLSHVHIVHSGRMRNVI